MVMVMVMVMAMAMATACGVAADVPFDSRRQLT
jgi:hypothetical protein